MPTEKTSKEGIIRRAVATLNGPEGLLVISDIDDTVKVTEAYLGSTAIMRKTFFEEFQAVPGMAQLYTTWARDLGADFAFVSLSPRELQEPLREFFISSGFPRAP